MKRLIPLLLIFVLVFAFTLTSCGNGAEEVRIIDFNDFTVNQIILWSHRQNVSEKFDYYFDYSDTIKAGNFISSSLKAGDVIGDKVEIRVSLGAKVVSAGEDSFNPYSPYGPEPYGPNPWYKQGIMPRVIGMSSVEAEAEIVKNGYKGEIKTVTIPSDQKGGTVIDCSPDAGFPFDLSGNNVMLVISKGGSGVVNIEIPYSGEQAMASVYVNGEFKNEFSTIVGSSDSKHANKISVSGEGEAIVKIIVHSVSYDPGFTGTTEYYFKVNFDKGTYTKTEDPGKSF